MQEKPMSFLDKIGDRANHFFDKIDLSKHKILELFIAAGIGFASGFFLKDMPIMYARLLFF